MTISISTLAKALEERGFTPEQILNFVAIARGESSYLFEAVNRHQEGGDEGDDSWGLFQINFTSSAAGEQRAKELGIPTKAEKMRTVRIHTSHGKTFLKRSYLNVILML